MSAEVVLKIGDEILADAQAEAKRKIEEAEKYASELKEKARLEAESEAEKAKAKALENVKLLEGRKLSEARREASLHILKERNTMISSAFQEAVKRLKDMVNEEAYLRSLSSLIETSVKQLGFNELKIKLNAKDLRRQAEIIKRLKLPPTVKITVDKDPVSALGGFIISTPDERIKIDETFEAKLTYAERKFKKEISKLLFGE